MNHKSRILGSLVRSVRKGLRLSQQEFADRCGVSRFTLGQIEGGHRGISPETAYKMSLVTGVGCHDLMAMAARDSMCNYLDELRLKGEET